MAAQLQESVWQLLAPILLQPNSRAELLGSRGALVS
jgi:hypothetical protein